MKNFRFIRDGKTIHDVEEGTSRTFGSLGEAKSYSRQQRDKGFGVRLKESLDLEIERIMSGRYFAYVAKIKESRGETTK